MPLLRGTRPLKRWRYVAIFCEELMACAAVVQVGPAQQTFWAVLLRGAGWESEARPGSEMTPESRPGSETTPRLLERTRLLPHRGAVQLSPGRLRVRDTSVETAGLRRGERGRSVALDLALDEGAGIAAVCPHGADRARRGGYVWTRKQVGIVARGTIALDGGPSHAIDALAVVDDTVGYHARVTEWRWAAGVGVDPTGTPLAFNLVEGVNDPPRGSERAVWIAGTPHEVPPVSFATDLSRISAADGSELRFEAEAQRSRRENLLLVRSEYEAPFGTFSGTLPGGVALARGLGVVEHHRARW
jgi:hypothetical protein